MLFVCSYKDFITLYSKNPILLYVFQIFILINDMFQQKSNFFEK